MIRSPPILTDGAGVGAALGTPVSSTDLSESKGDYQRTSSDGTKLAYRKAAGVQHFQCAEGLRVLGSGRHFAHAVSRPRDRIPTVSPQEVSPAQQSKEHAGWGYRSRNAKCACIKAMGKHISDVHFDSFAVPSQRLALVGASSG